MNDDDLLKRLGAVAREQRREAPDTDAPSLDADARARIADHLATRLAPRTATPMPARARNVRVIAFATGGLALAAALVLVLRREGSTPGADLPGYSFDDSAVAATRAPASSAVASAGPCKIHAND